MERVAGIEPASSAWKAEVLPLNYTRNTRKTRKSMPANLYPQSMHYLYDKGRQYSSHYRPHANTRRWSVKAAGANPAAFIFEQTARRKPTAPSFCYQPIQHLNYSVIQYLRQLNGGGGWIRTSEARASDLQSDPFGHSGTPPKRAQYSDQASI